MFLQHALSKGLTTHGAQGKVGSYVAGDCRCYPFG